MLSLDVLQHEVNVDEITLQAQCSHKHKTAVEPMWRAAEDAIQEQDARDGERDVEHALQEERKHAVLLLLQEDACQKRHQEHQPYHPDGGSVQGLLLPYHLSHVDADEEDRHSAPEYLQMSHRLVYWRNIFHQYAPHDHYHGQPTVDGVSLDEFHVGWGEAIEHHRGRNVPEVELIVQPKSPVDADFSEEIDPVP